MSIKKMSLQEIETGLQKLPGWTLKEENLHRELKFKDFVQAFGFMTQAAITAEKMNHHPEWSNVYSQVTINLTTHEANGISQLDFELAEKMNSILSEMES
jgi:4a-hydroxytetrahydrobiopterin dehydratase